MKWAAAQTRRVEEALHARIIEALKESDVDTEALDVHRLVAALSQREVGVYLRRPPQEEGVEAGERGA